MKKFRNISPIIFVDKYILCSIFVIINTVELGDKELFGHPKIVPYPYEVNGKLVTGNGSLIPICSLLPSLTAFKLSI